jgi:hypothetical protein
VHAWCGEVVHASPSQKGSDAKPEPDARRDDAERGTRDDANRRRRKARIDEQPDDDARDDAPNEHATEGEEIANTRYRLNVIVIHPSVSDVGRQHRRPSSAIGQRTCRKQRFPSRFGGARKISRRLRAPDTGLEVRNDLVTPAIGVLVDAAEWC